MHSVLFFCAVFFLQLFGDLYPKHALQVSQDATRDDMFSFSNGPASCADVGHARTFLERYDLHTRICALFILNARFRRRGCAIDAQTLALREQDRCSRCNVPRPVRIRTGDSSALDVSFIFVQFVSNCYTVVTKCVYLSGIE